MKEIQLTQGKVALIDDEDYDKVISGRWYAHLEKKTWYATGKHGNYHRMHRLIMGVADPKIIIDHKDGNGLNNQKSNLRIATTSQNISNSRPRDMFTSKYKGVHWDRFNNKWRVQVQNKDVIKRIGRFENEIDAALAYNKAAMELHGEFARLNAVKI